MHPAMPKKPTPSGAGENALEALRNVPPLLRMVWETSPGSASRLSFFDSLRRCYPSRCSGSRSSSSTASWRRIEPNAG